MEFMLKGNKRPDIIHCHDWQTALVPVFLFEIYQHMRLWHPRVCYTIHNFKHQGVTGADLVALADHDFQHTGDDLSAHILGHVPYRTTTPGAWRR